jgi:hypothetical protein
MYPKVRRFFLAVRSPFLVCEMSNYCNCHYYFLRISTQAATLLLTEPGYEFCPDSTPGIFEHIRVTSLRDIGSVVDGPHLQCIREFE